MSLLRKLQQPQKMISKISIFYLVFVSTVFTVHSVEPRGNVNYNDNFRNLRKKKGGKNKNNKKCPKATPVSSGNKKCGVKGQKCAFKYTSTIPGGVCENQDDCICKDGAWDCKENIGCVSDNPPFIIGCPETSPAQTKEKACDDEHQDDPCSYVYPSTIPGGVCESTDICTCSKGKWECKIKQACVSDNPPFIIACPEISPNVSKELSCDDEHQEDPCTFEYTSTVEGGTCQNKDSCSCLKGNWNCESTIGCVSDNPPSIGNGN
jgi:hypothetical protein